MSERLDEVSGDLVRGGVDGELWRSAEAAREQTAVGDPEVVDAAVTSTLVDDGAERQRTHRMDGGQQRIERPISMSQDAVELRAIVIGDMTAVCG